MASQDPQRCDFSHRKLSLWGPSRPLLWPTRPWQQCSKLLAGSGWTHGEQGTRTEPPFLQSVVAMATAEARASETNTKNGRHIAKLQPSFINLLREASSLTSWTHSPAWRCKLSKDCLSKRMKKKKNVPAYLVKDTTFLGVAEKHNL